MGSNKETTYEVHFDSNRNVIITKLSEQTSVVVPWEEMYDKIIAPRNFAFEHYNIPKVTAYVSSGFEFNGEQHAFLFSTLNPRIVESESQDPVVKTYIPWTHMFILVNLNTNAIVEAVLFFSDSQIKSEFYHDFHVPNVDSEHLQTSEVLSQFFGITQPVYRAEHALEDVELIFPNDLARIKVRDIWNKFIQHFLFYASLDVPFSTEENEFTESMSGFWREDPISISVFDEVAMKNSATPPSFYSVIDYLFTKNQTSAEKIKKPIKVDKPVAKESFWDSSTATTTYTVTNTNIQTTWIPIAGEEDSL